mgnify:CR=1 FL=1
MTVVIEMSGGKQTIVDDEDAELAMQFRWKPAGYRKRYAGRTDKRGGGNRCIFLHRVIAGAKDGERVDHIDRDPLNNRRNNLRIVTNAQNMQNSSGHKDSRTGVRNVTFDPKRGYYQVQVRVDGHNKTIGYFRDLESAGAAALQARLRYYTHSDGR